MQRFAAPCDGLTAIGRLAVLLLVLAWVPTDAQASAAPDAKAPVRVVADGQPPIVSAPSPARESSRPPDGAALSSLGGWTAGEVTSAFSFGTTVWTARESFPVSSGHMVGASAGGAHILHTAGGGYRVHDRVSGTSARVDTFFDGTPLPDDVAGAAISGDGRTVALRRAVDGEEQPRLRIVRPGENFEIALPDPGTQTWSSGWVEQCSLYTRMGPLHLSDDGKVAWFTTSPCFYDRVFAIDVSDPSPRWRFIHAFRDYTSEVTADGKSFALGGDFYQDDNWNNRRDPDEELFGIVTVAPIEFIDNQVPGRAMDWDYWEIATACHLPPGSRARVDGAGQRILVTTDAIGLDPDTLVYEPGHQLYWKRDGNCRMHSLGGTDALRADELRLSSDGRAALSVDADGGVVRRDLATGQADSFSDVTIGAADPLLGQAARVRYVSAPGTGSSTGAVLETAMLAEREEPRKVAILGDSYISGEGTFGYLPGTNVHGANENLCHRSYASWAYLLGLRLANYRADQVGLYACSGATTDQVEGRQYGEEGQLSRLKRFNEDGRPVDVVFASIGGNDAGFKEMILDCAFGRCLRSHWKEERLRGARHGAVKVRETLLEIKRAAPDATVLLTGYPSIVRPPDGDCGDLGLTEVQRSVLRLSPYTSALETAVGGLRIDREEQAWFDEVLIPALNSDLGRAAAEAGVRFVDPTAWFAGHGVCSATPFANGIVPGDDLPEVRPVLGNESFHPNAAGHEQLMAGIEARHSTSLRAGLNPPPVPQGLTDPGAPDQLTALVVDGELRAWGDQGQFSVQNLPGGMRVVVGMYSSPTFLGAATVGPDGTARIPYVVPAGLHPGLHAVVAYDEASGEPVASTLTAIDPPEDCLTGDGGVDVDQDALADHCDAWLADGPSADADADGVLNSADGCPTVADPAQEDLDGNGVGDACDPEAGFNPVADLQPPPDVTVPRPPPTLTLLSSLPARSGARDVAIAFEAGDPGGHPLTVTCALDGGAPAPCSSPFEVSDLPEGNHRVTVAARSFVGLWSEPLVVDWTVDRTRPSVRLVFGPTVSTPDWSQFVFDGWDPPFGMAASYRCAVDGAPPTPCSSPLALGGLGEGTHTFAVTSVDGAGNESDPATWTWTVREPPPVPPDTWTTTFPLGPSRRATPPPAPRIGQLPRVVRAGVVEIPIVSGGDAGGGYDLRLRRAGYRRPALTPWRTPGALRGLTTLPARVAVGAGERVCVSARARSQTGTGSAWSDQRCMAGIAPARKLRRSRGWRGRSALTGRRRGLTVTVPPSGHGRSVLVVRRCPGCGSLRIGGRLVRLSGPRRAGHVIVVSPAGRGAKVRTASARPVHITGYTAVDP